MKKLIIAALLVISVSAFAQAQNQSNKKGNKPNNEKMSPEQRNEALLKKMTNELSLTAQQQEQVKPIIAEQMAKMEVIRDERANGNLKEMSKEERQAFKTKRQEDKKATDAKLQAILTPDQFKKMKEMEEAKKEKMRENRGDGNWGKKRDNGGDGNNGDNGGNNDDN